MYFCYMPYTYNNTYMVEPVYNGQPWDLQTWLLLSEVILLYSQDALRVTDHLTQVPHALQYCYITMYTNMASSAAILLSLRSIF